MKTAPRTTAESANPPQAPAPASHQDTASRLTRRTTAGRPDRPHPARRMVLVAVAAIAVAAIAVAIGTFTGAPSGEQSLVEAQDEQSALERLVRLGYVPSEALQPSMTEDALTRGLQARGLIPTAPSAAAPLSDAAAHRSSIRALVSRGLVPPATLQPTTEQGHTDALIVRGLLPEGS